MTAPNRDPAAEAGRRRRWPWLAGGAVVVAAAVLVWFQPQKLLIDDRVDEAIPTVTQSTASPSVPSSDTEGAVEETPAEVARGAFVSLDHGTTGVARILEVDGGSRIVRFEDLRTDNGPDLFVYLTAARADGSESAFDDDFVDLGRLKGNLGNQNYELGPDVDLERYATVVIWCDRFNSAFGAADLVPAAPSG